MRIQRVAVAVGLISGALFLGTQGFAQGENEGQGKVIVTVLPKHEGDATPSVAAAGAKLKINGKDASIAKLVPLGANSPVELVVLIDGSARNSLGRQFEDLEKFVKTLPPNVYATFAYMQNGNSVIAGPFSDDHAVVLKGLHLPGGSAGSNASPYFCLSDLAKRWPSRNLAARREVLMITDGVDPYNLRFDPDNPYLQSAIRDSAKAGLVVYSIYWRGQGWVGNSQYENNTGQNLSLIVTEATGGKSFWMGTGNPVSFEPFLEELTRRFNHQYELSFVSTLKGKSEVQQMKLKLSVPGSSVDAPQQVFVVRPGSTQE